MVVLVVDGTSFKRSRNGFLVIAKKKNSLQFSMPQHAVAGTASNFIAFVLGTARAPASFSLTK
jgi:hypothetical protein